MEHKRAFGLDLLRAMAIAMVLLGHYIAKFDLLGRYGVELFFVLSGYLIGGLLLKDLDKYENYKLSNLYIFLKRRWYRTLPNYYLFLAINYFLFIYYLGTPSLVFDYKYLFFMQNFAWDRSAFFGESWSLSVEEWFYLVFSTILYLNIKLFKNKNKSFLVSILTILFFSLITRSFFSDDVKTQGYIVIFRLDSIMFGVLFAYIKKNCDGIWSKLEFFSYLGVPSIILIIAIDFMGHFSGLGLNNFLYVLTPISYALLLPKIVKLNQPRSILLNKAVTSTSLWSYSLYLTHLPILLFFKNIFHDYIQTTPSKILFRLLCLALAFLLSAFIYRYFEVPITKLRDRNN